MNLSLTHPNDHINRALAPNVFKYLRQTGFTRRNTRISKTAFSFLNRAGIPFDTEPSDLLGSYALVGEAAMLQKELVVSGAKRTDLRSVIREYDYLKPLVSHGPQSLLHKSYLPLSRNLFSIDMGTSSYGFGKDYYREIVDNVIAARLMFEAASKKVADLIYGIYRSDCRSLAIVGGGSGNGAAELDIIKAFGQNRPKFILSDIDKATELEARKLFASHDIHGINWIKVDLGIPSEVRGVAREVADKKKVIVPVNFIVHENKNIAELFFGTMSTVLPNATLAISEFFLAPDGMTHPAIPEWFIALHGFSGQFLRTEEDFMKIAKKYGYKIVHRIDHQIVQGLPIVSTIFLER